MKDEIQVRLLERYKGMTEEEIDADQRLRILANPILAPLCRRLNGEESSSGAPSEFA